MAISRAKKEDMVASYEQGLGGSANAFLVGFDKITVAQVDDLRRRVRESGGHYEVVKNRLAKRAIEGTPFESLGEHFNGMTAVAYSDDAVGLAKALTDFAKEEPVLEFKAGLVDGQAVSGDDIKNIANLPSREELIAKLLFLLQSPISRFARTLGAIPQQFVTVLDQVAQQKGE